MVLDVVVHVPVDPTVEWAHIYGATVQAMVDRVLGETCVLRKSEHDKKPMSIDAW